MLPPPVDRTPLADQDSRFQQLVNATADALARSYARMRHAHNALLRAHEQNDQHRKCIAESLRVLEGLRSS